MSTDGHKQSTLYSERKVQIALSLLIFAVVVAIVPFGSTSAKVLPLAGIVMCISCGTACWIGRFDERQSWFVLTILLSLISTIIWVLIQNALSKSTALSDIAMHDGSVKFSIEPADSAYSLLYVLIPGLTFFSAYLLSGSDQTARRILFSSTLIGVSVALYGIVQLVCFPESNLFGNKPAYTDSLTSTFVNRNSAGTFLGLTLLLCIRQALSAGRGLSRGSISRLLDGRSMGNVQQHARFGMCIIFVLLTLTALFLTKSRGAVAATGFASLVLLLIDKNSRDILRMAAIQPPGFRYITFLLFSVIGVLAILVVLAGRVLVRVELANDARGRFCVLPDIADLVRDNLLTGYGFGNFRYAFGAYRRGACGIEFLWDRAHNFYLEGLGGLGIIFLIQLAVLLVCFIAAHIIGLERRRRMRSYSALGVASLALVSGHSLVDFSLQIPGVAAYFAMIVGCTSAISLKGVRDAPAETS